jgi:hypothetical protein
MSAYDLAMVFVEHVIRIIEGVRVIMPVCWGANSTDKSVTLLHRS